MGIFETYHNSKTGNQRISENFLKKLGFKKSNQWGAPFRWGPNTEFWEKIIQIDETHTDASVLYFPPTFKGYVTDFNINGDTAANKMICQLNTDVTTYDFTHSALCKNDIQFGIDRITYNLKKYYKRH